MTKKNAIIRVGQCIVIEGSPYTVLRRERGRQGEDRTVYVIERRVDGHRETRNRSSLLRYASPDAEKPSDP